MFTRESVIAQAEEEESMLETFFRFPPISKISVQVVHALQNVDSLQCQEMTLEVQAMGSISPQSIEDDLHASLAAQSASCKASSITPVEQLAQCIASLHPQFSASASLKEKLFLLLFLFSITRRVTVPCTELIFSVSFLAHHPSVIRIDVQTQYTVPHSISPSSFSRVLRDVDVDVNVKGSVHRDVDVNVKGSVLRDVDVNVKGSVHHDASSKEVIPHNVDVDVNVKGSVHHDASSKEVIPHNVDVDVNVKGSVLRDVNVDVNVNVNVKGSVHHYASSKEVIPHNINVNMNMKAPHNSISQEKERVLRDSSQHKERIRAFHTYKSQERMSTRNDVLPLYKHSIHILSPSPVFS